MKDKRTKKAFIDYLNDPRNKDLRFWQALRNFSQWDFIYATNSPLDVEGVYDTFYTESDEEGI